MSLPEFKRPSARLVGADHEMLAKVTGDATAQDSPSEGAALAAQMPGKRVRIVVNVSEELQRRIHVRALTRGVTITDYITELLRKDGVGENAPFAEAAR